MIIVAAMTLSRSAFVSSLLLVACSSTPDNAPPAPASGGMATATSGETAGHSFADVSVPWADLAPDPTSSYSAELSGTPIGSGTEPIASVRKRVALETSPANLAAQLGVTFGAAYLLRSSGGRNADLVAAMKNVSTTILCDRDLSIAGFFAADGSAISAASTSITTVGSSGLVTNSASSQPREYIDSCIAAGSVGYFVTQFVDVPTLFERGAAVRIQLDGAPSTLKFAEIMGSVSPTAYTVDGTNLMVAIHNGTTDPISVWETLILELDADGLPLGWNRGPGTMKPLAPDATAMTSPTVLGYAGPPTTRLRVFAEFDYHALP